MRTGPASIECYDLVAPEHAGWLDRTEWWWGLYEKDTQEDQYFVYGIDGADGDLAGYMSFEQKAAGAMGMGYEIHVEELDRARAVGGGRRSGASSARTRCRSTHITVNRGPVDALLLVLPEQDVEQTGNNRWMHRLVDAPAAIAARGFPPNVAAEVHLDLTDRLAPWNEGQWVLRVEGGRGELVAGGTGAIQLTINGVQRALDRLGVGAAARRSRRAPPRHARRPRRPRRDLRRPTPDDGRRLLTDQPVLASLDPPERG